MLGEARLAEIGEAISDGTPIDWDKVGGSESDAERAILRELKVVANIVQLHRDLPSGPRPAVSRESIAESGMATGQWEEHWGHLRLLDKIGHGSFGDVYRAWDTRLDREVALKLLRQPQSRSAAAATTTVIEEGRMLARVRHPNVVTVFGAERLDGRIGVWMEFIQGRTLEQLIRERGVFSAREAMLIASDLCRALSAVHRAGLLHRDLKAQNVMREEGGRIVLMDFGTGRDQIQAGSEPIQDFAGTPLYLAPEILRGKPATARSDVYSLGVLLFRLVTGEYPLPGKTLREVSAAHDRGAHVAITDLRPDLPDAFVQLMQRALATDPQARFETAGAMEQALSRALALESSRPEPVPLTPSEATPVPAPVPLLQPAPAPPGRRFHRWGIAAATLLVLVGVVSLLVATGVLSLPWRTTALKTIAVLPFVNQTQRSTLTTDGMAEVLSANLHNLGSLSVTSTTTMRLYRDSRKSLKEIARELGVDVVVEGFMIGEGDRVQLIVNVIGSYSDTALLNKTFEPKPDVGLLAFQTEVARAIADAIALKLTPEQVGRLALASGPSTFAGAQASYLLGFRQLGEPWQVNAEAAVRLLEEAVRADPSYAQAHTHLADAYIRLANVSTMISRSDSIRLARATAEKARSLAPDQAGPYVSLARVRQYFDWDWAGAEEMYRRALQVDPRSADAGGYYAMFLAAFKRFDEALDQARRARDRDPGPAVRSTSVAAILAYARRHDEALAEINTALTLDPTFVTGLYTRGLQYTALGRYDEAIDSIEQSLSGFREVGRLADLARVYALQGRAADARRTIDEMVEARKRGARLSPDKLSFIHAALGETDRAFEYLERAVEEKSSNLAWLNVDPRWDQMRGDQRFAAIVTRMGFDK